MPIYLYKARDATAKPVKGTMEAASKEELTDKLYKMGYAVTQISEAASGFDWDRLLEKLFQRINSEQLILFYIQLSNMLSANMSLLNCLRNIQERLENKQFKEIINSIARSIEAGSNFSEAVTQYPRIFPKLFLHLAKAGEASGKLGLYLSRYADYSQQQEELQRKIKSALLYPVILLCAGIAVTLFIITFLVPQFAEIYLRAGIRLPMPTMILYQVGIGIKQFWYAGIFIFIAAYFALNYYKGTKAGRLKVDRIKLNLPVVGELYRKSAISRFAKTLSTLVSSGVPILEALIIVKEVVGNEVLARVIATARSSVERGEGIAASLKVSTEFPADVVQMIAAGEETGEIPSLLNKIAEFYDLSLDYSIRKLTTLIEPVLLVVTGSMVGFIMASMLLPMFDMIKVLRH
ncbi:MAG: type II secretion system F family protein [Candidatus Omnitrophota bacterium]